MVRVWTIWVIECGGREKEDDVKEGEDGRSGLWNQRPVARSKTAGVRRVQVLRGAAAAVWTCGAQRPRAFFTPLDPIPSLLL